MISKLVADIVCLTARGSLTLSPGVAEFIARGFGTHAQETEIIEITTKQT